MAEGTILEIPDPLKMTPEEYIKEYSRVNLELSRRSGWTVDYQSGLKYSVDLGGYLIQIQPRVVPFKEPK